MTYCIEKIVKRTIEKFNIKQEPVLDTLKKDYPEKEKEIEYDYKRQLDVNFRNFMDNQSQKIDAIDTFRKNEFKKKIRRKSLHSIA